LVKADPSVLLDWTGSKSTASTFLVSRKGSKN
jgi:hypothetical protein